MSSIDKFQSTPPARGATPLLCDSVFFLRISIHAPREGGDSSFMAAISQDWNFNPRPPRGGRLPIGEAFSGVLLFQSTPPARGATDQVGDNFNQRFISIHAPREGGDGTHSFPRILCLDFNPRPPRGGRLGSPTPPLPQRCHFNPRPPRGGRQQRCTVLPADL